MLGVSWKEGVNFLKKGILTVIIWLVWVSSVSFKSGLMSLSVIYRYIRNIDLFYIKRASPWKASSIILQASKNSINPLKNLLLMALLWSI